MIDSHSLRKLFPVFQTHPDLCYLDTPASSLTSEPVITKLRSYYEESPVNVARGLYDLSQNVTQEMELVRAQVASFFSTNSKEEIIFTRNTTESLNLLARTLLPTLSPGDEIITTSMEHHANFVPWQQLAKQYNLTFTVLDIEENGTLSLEKIHSSLSQKTRIFTFTHASNVLGTINDAQEIISHIRTYNPDIITIVDGAQSAGHLPIDLRDIDCDFFACSGHKMFGPKGVGILFGKEYRLKSLPPFLYGGEMVSSVTKKESSFKEIPFRFEAGTPSIADIIGLGASLNFIKSLTREAIAKHDHDLALRAWEELSSTFGKDIILFGPLPKEHFHSGILSFSFKGIHPHDIAQVLAEDSICVRAGTHCAMPLHKESSLPYHASVRAGFSIYNTPEDITRLIKGLQKAQKIFRI